MLKWRKWWKMWKSLREFNLKPQIFAFFRHSQSTLFFYFVNNMNEILFYDKNFPIVVEESEKGLKITIKNWSRCCLLGKCKFHCVSKIYWIILAIIMTGREKIPIVLYKKSVKKRLSKYFFVSLSILCAFFAPQNGVVKWCFCLISIYQPHPRTEHKISLILVLFYSIILKILQKMFDHRGMFKM